MINEGIKAGTSNIVEEAAVFVDTLFNENAFKVHLEDQIKVHSQDKDSSSFQESTNDSLNRSNLSPTKFFASKDEGWQEVQSKKKKKASQAQFTRPFTWSSKTISQ
ncbi:hypothetical protein PanWU01x14_096110 [Parasponia andersonii]|uniref:Uncharacterized protein n=1 Tax=Parasponia andersonii TaxID=3476 RepID=A0A2P5D4R0_PARAD|nr:hypothetical protein PanWU01x14_096110 [Parasponia andersonii]